MIHFAWNKFKMDCNNGSYASAATVNMNEKILIHMNSPDQIKQLGECASHCVF